MLQTTLVRMSNWRKFATSSRWRSYIAGTSTSAKPSGASSPTPWLASTWVAPPTSSHQIFQKTKIIRTFPANTRTDGQWDLQADGRTEREDGRTETDGRTQRRTLTYIWTDWQRDRRMDSWTGRQIDRRSKRRTDGLTERRRTDGRTDREMDTYPDRVMSGVHKTSYDVLTVIYKLMVSLVSSHNKSPLTK